MTTLTQKLTTAMPAILSTGGQMLEALVQGVAQNIPVLLSSATGIVINLVKYLDQHADQIVDGGIRLVESLITGIVNNLPALITAAGQLIASFAGALLKRAPDLLRCGGDLLEALVNGLLHGIATLGEAALAMVAKLVGVWDGSYSQWGNIGTNIVKGLWEGIQSGWNGLLAKVKGLVDLLPDIAKKALGIHSPSKVFDEIGVNTCKGLAQGLARGTAKVKDAAETVVASVTDTATRLVDEVTTIAADGTKTVSKTIEDAGPQYASAGEMLTTQLRTKLTQGW